MIRLRKFKRYADKGKSEEIISFINETRSNYPYSQRIYSEKDMDNVYLILYQQRIAGFCEAELRKIKLKMLGSASSTYGSLAYCSFGLK